MTPESIHNSCNVCLCEFSTFECTSVHTCLCIWTSEQQQVRVGVMCPLGTRWVGKGASQHWNGGCPMSYPHIVEQHLLSTYCWATLAQWGAYPSASAQKILCQSQFKLTYFCRHTKSIYAEDFVIEFVAVILDLSEKEISLVSECVPSILPKPNIM